MDAVEDRRARRRGLEFGLFDALGGVDLFERLEERGLGVLFLWLLLRGRRIDGLFAEKVFRALGHGQQAGFVALHLDDARAFVQVDSESLGDLAGGVEFQHKAADLGRLFSFVVVLIGFFATASSGRSIPIRVWQCRAQGPEPHGREAGIRFKASGVGVFEDHREGFVRDGGPDVLQVFAERNDDRR